MKVSVLMITYNHEPFIAQAIESVLMQRTDFDYELVIGEDCSTDRTRDIVVNYRDRYPGRLRAFLRPQNLGANENFIAALEACQGEYVAWLDGDDYWTSPDKLQTQIEYMDSHPESAISFHNAVVFVEGNPMEGVISSPPTAKAFFDLQDILQRDFILTCSVVLRRSMIGEFPVRLQSLKGVDWPLLVLCAQRGTIGFVDEVMAAHRIHAGGVWSSLSLSAQMAEGPRFYELIAAHLRPEYGAVIAAASRNWTAEMHLRCAWQACTECRIEDGKVEAMRALQIEPALADDQAAKVLESLLNWVQHPSVRSPTKAAERVLSVLHGVGLRLGRHKGEVLATAAMAEFYRGYERGDWRTVRCRFPSAVLHDRTWLHNRGAILMWLESVVGTKPLRALRATGRWAGGLRSRHDSAGDTGS